MGGGAWAGGGVVRGRKVEPMGGARGVGRTGERTEVLPACDETATEELTMDEMPSVVYTATKDGAVAGYAVQTMTKQGFSGVVRLMVGFTPEGEVVNVNVLEQSETPGLGTKMTEEGNPLLKSIQGQRLEDKQLVDGRLAVRKDGGDVDALTAATISSRAYVDAINRAWLAYKSVATGAAPADVASRASQTAQRATAPARTAGPDARATHRPASRERG